MTPEERELRRALDSRSEQVSPEFRARLSSALAEGRPTSNLLPALAAVAAVVLVFATVGVLLLARQARNQPPPVAATTPTANATPTPSPLATPSPTPEAVAGVLTKPANPIALPANANLSAPSSNVVWALMVDQYLYRSTNGGVTWQQRPLPDSRQFCPAATAPCAFPGAPEISFVNDQEGWLSISGASHTQTVTLWHTTDAGATWMDLAPRGIGDGKSSNGLSFIDSNRGFINAWNPNQITVIYMTIDGGQTWTASAPLLDPPGFKTVCECIALQAGAVRAFGSVLLIPVWQPSGPGIQYVYRSTDGGATWAYLASAPGQDGNVDFVTAARWLKLIGPGQSTETTDAGARWHPYPSNYSQAAPIAADFVFGDSLVGYATVRGGITSTEDGGLHWVSIKPPGT
jgi:photosystem II stability/assembly factor-like uncharacterized protein